MWSPCSRTCGVGVKFRGQLCLRYENILIYICNRVLLYEAAVILCFDCRKRCLFFFQRIQTLYDIFDLTVLIHMSALAGFFLYGMKMFLPRSVMNRENKALCQKKSRIYQTCNTQVSNQNSLCMNIAMECTAS